MIPFTSGPKTPPRVGETTGGQLSPPSTACKSPATPQQWRGTAADQLLTPPLTGKTVRFLEDDDSRTKNKCRLDRNKQDESALAEYADLDDLGDLSDISILDETPAASNPPSPTQDPVSSQPLRPVIRDDAAVNAQPKALGDTTLTSTENTITVPFPFLELPLSIRKNIYSMLLVVPGLVCVRQNHTSYHNEEKAFLYAEARLLLPRIAYALPQITVGGFKVRFSRFRYANAAILRVSKEVLAEARAVMYGENNFEIICPNLEMSPPPDYKIPLFPRGCARHVRSLSIRVRALYPLKWLLNGGYGDIKNAYRGLEMLIIVFEMESAAKGVGKVLGKGEDEKWVAYVTRLHTHLNAALFGSSLSRPLHPCHLPCWIHFRVLFDGEAYDDFTEPTTHSINVGPASDNTSLTDAAKERFRRYHLKRGLPEAFEMCKRGGR
ncbi:uncharacterized protein N0V89_004202 [Didymosphaeria variabile]|uniref:F-box domain-containing protein n=1 Tax=Didymosphaeria variabile TaxID=1932322 RepID=A0A9W9CD79_9PLEO|nr:uncharacterized protein N0V89_004202 [Didymosphaeria variabile]KAJ4356172.1 hypothetical protein N0V89_004202 [Didymosphaeria variabile]